MTNLMAARSQMALSLGFHIIFAAMGVAMPFLMAAAHWRFLKTGDAAYRTLTQAWSKGVAIFFAVGAVSGTALSFELGLLWPEFMKIAGPIIGMPFSWEGTAFFLEAIALGIFLYGWDKVKPWTHWWSGMLVGVSGVTSAFFVICANAWMNSPTGFDWNDGNPIHIDPWAAMFNDAAFIQGLHMVLAAFEAVGFAVAGLHALLYLRTRRKLHAQALKIAFVFGAVAALLQPFVGDLAAKGVARRQPLKLAAMESLFQTQTQAPLVIGGIPNLEKQRTDYGFEIPGLLSFLVAGNPKAEVKGLDAFDRHDWPKVAVTHIAFQVMVALGSLLALVGLIGLWGLYRNSNFFSSFISSNISYSSNFSKVMLYALILCIPLGFIALEAGWIVTEVGRQPWIIYGFMRTSEAVTTRPGVVYTFISYAVLYSFLALVVSLLMVRQIRALHRDLDRTESK